MRTAIATVCLSGGLDEKLDAIAAAGFRSVEIFENDLLSSNGTAADVAKQAKDLGLKIAVFQPFRDFEGMPDAQRIRTFDRAERKFDVMQQLGCDLLMVCSNVAPDALAGIDRAADDFRELGDRAAKRGMRVGFEALAWGRHINDYRDACAPNGLANGSGQLGRNYMRHNMSVLMAVLPHANDIIFQKTLAFSDFYFGADDWNHPLGLVQMCAKSQPEQIRGEVLPEWLEWLPKMPFEVMAHRSMDFWLQAEDLPHPQNRIYYRDGKVHLDLVETNPQALSHLKRKLKEVLSRSGRKAVLLERSLYFGKDIPLGGTAHQAGTARFGPDPATSVLDLDCKAHELDNLYLADASFFPAIGAVNPTLTVIANALRVADRIAERLK